MASVYVYLPDFFGLQKQQHGRVSRKLHGKPTCFGPHPPGINLLSVGKLYLHKIVWRLGPQ
jgi:hypothetical protein